MYSVTFRNPGDDYETLVWSDKSATEDTKVSKVDLSLVVNSAGSLSITLPYTNAGYSMAEHLITEVKVWRNDISDEMKVIWTGRVLTENLDFWNNRVLFCEGELAYLNDSIQPPAVYRETTISGFLSKLLEIHNSRYTSERYKFYLGTVTVQNDNLVYRYTNYNTTLECIQDKLIDRYGGILRIRYVDGKRYLDYLADFPNESPQIIEFGKNLLDITRYWDLSEFATAIIPLGAQLDTVEIENDVVYDPGDGTIYKDPDTQYPATQSDIQDEFLYNPTLVVGDKDYRKLLGFKLDGDIAKVTYIKPNATTPTKADISTLSTIEDYYPVLEEYLTIADVNDGSIYLENTSAISTYGRYEKVVYFDDLHDATNLKEEGQEYLVDMQYDGVEIDLTAFDLHYLNVDVESINLLDMVRVISEPHGLDRLFPVTELTIPLNKPGDAKISLGGKIDGTSGKLSDITSGTIKAVQKK